MTKSFDSGRRDDARDSASTEGGLYLYFCQLVLPVWLGIAMKALSPHQFIQHAGQIGA